jgi:hypothetical protein
MKAPLSARVHCRPDFMPTLCDAITHAAYLAINVVTANIVVDAVAVADVEPVLGAVPPDRVLNEPREGVASEN